MAVLLAGAMGSADVLADDGSIGLQEIKLDALSPLASSGELTARLLSPITQLRIVRYLDHADSGLAEQSIRVGEETYDLFVPTEPGPAGYGVMVYVWPGDRMAMPVSWRRQFESRHMIFIAARHSGNDENVLDRRVPLALHGYGYVAAHYRIDPVRVYIGGFSGGSRVAQKIALGYPDIFHGLFLAGGSDPIGTAGFVPPSRELMRLFQQRMRIVYATGSQDFPNRTKDARAKASFADFCVQGVEEASPARTGHWVPEDRDMTRVLRLLEDPMDKDEAAFPDCERRLQADIRSRLDTVETLHAAGRDDDARTKLTEADGLYGGFASPDSLRLAAALYPELRSAPNPEPRN